MSGEIEKNIIEKLKGMGFDEDPEKKLLFRKEVDNSKIAFWDFRKTSKGRFYVTEIGGSFLNDVEAKKFVEYKALRTNEDKEENKKQFVKPTIISPSKTEDIILRGTEDDITNVVKQRNINLIKKASVNKDKPGEGILYYDEKIGNFNLVEPSVELIDLITAQMGDIKVKIITVDTRTHYDIETGDEFHTYYAIVKAVDNKTGTEGLGSAEEIIDFNEMKRKHNPRTFALTKAIRKAERNAKERLIPVPRKAMVELVKEIMKG